MKAAVVHELGQPLTVEDHRLGAPGPYQVLVRIEASGLCHTDIHAARGDWPVQPTPPFVPGHEGIGVVEEAGSSVTGVSVGDRVGTRLEGPPIPREGGDAGMSLPMVRGAIQLPGSGEPVVLGPDHPTTGGYPIIAALTDAARDLAGQLPPGVRVRFRVVS